MDIKKIRVRRLEALIKSLGGAAAVAREYDDINPSYLSQLINEIRPFGEKSARNLEHKLNLATGYFDIEHEEYKYQSNPQKLFLVKEPNKAYEFNSKNTLYNIEKQTIIQLFEKLTRKQQSIVLALIQELTTKK